MATEVLSLAAAVKFEMSRDLSKAGVEVRVNPPGRLAKYPSGGPSAAGMTSPTESQAGLMRI
jgi:hypothetical protein